MQEEEMELTAKQLAEAFGVQPGTVSKWKTSGKLTASKPGGANRLGLHAKLSDVYLFIETVPEDDREYTRERFNRWLRRYRAQRGQVAGRGQNVSRKEDDMDLVGTAARA